MTELMPSLCNDCVARNQCGNDDVKMCISYTKETKIKCDDCKFVENCVDYGWKDCKKFTPKQSEPMTNEEWFCQLSTEEKAKWMAKHMSFCEVCEIQTCRGDGCQRFDRGSMTETDAFREWLKEKHDGNMGRNP